MQYRRADFSDSGRFQQPFSQPYPSFAAPLPAARPFPSPQSPFHPVHFRRKQAFSARFAAAVLDEVYGLPGHPHPYPVVAKTAGAVVDGGATLQVTVTFAPGSVGSAGPLMLNESATACPAGGPPSNFSYASCAWPQIQGSDGVWRNATLSVGADGASVVMSAPATPPAQLAAIDGLEADTSLPAGISSGSVTPVACAYGWGVWPMAFLFTADGFPALPWNVTL